ncbi:MAG TPA: S41 family peptidase [Pseudomonadales bacterium]|nr:S41 family peptidase [Pseudomonadales bacterium]
MKKSLRRLSVTTLAIYVVALCLNSAWCATAKPPTPKTEGQLPLDDLRTFARVMEQIRATYVEEVDDKTLLENAIRGMLSELDPHSAYLDEKDFSDLQSATSGEFAGLGIEVGMEDGFVKVISPIDDTPASRAGIESGDIIIKLGDKSVQGMSLDEAVSLMRGKAGEALNLTILRQHVEKPIEVTLVRDAIKARSIKQKTLEPGYGYVRIAQFQINTAEDLNSAIAALKKDGAIQGLVLDLRNNPGGLLQSAVDVSDAFLNKGLIVYTKGRAANSNLRYNAEPGDILGGAPMVVLINDGSASAAEIVAGALQDNRRAVLLGTNSFGKGSVQTVVPISETKAIKLTTALYYTPSGRSIQAEGIKPDIVDEHAKITSLQPSLRAAESDLDKHLGNGNATDKKSAAKPKGKVDDDNWRQDDNQLHDALNILKAMRLSKRA